MIRINLIAGERRAQKATGGRSLQIGQKITILGSLILLIAVLLVGWRYWALTQRGEQLTRDIAAARREEQRLAEVLKEVAQAEAQTAQLQQRVALIEELRRGQTAPVHIVDQISRSLPDMTWLTSLTQEGYEVTIEGRSTSQNSVSDFVSNLEATRYFKEPVEIVESEVVRAAQDAPDLISFTIKGTFQMAGMEKPAAPPAPAKKAPAKGGTGG
jgi:type IV pilus assembly protein PilN